ncbi:DUF2868 domain-containing protein [Nitrincola sp. MINF-07-Sa-05]|uniref:DUF2868 domain-containing protein n=1 Tax=Nitrincola salilacus TaxID=3400273 RepID=UPI003917CEFD
MTFRDRLIAELIKARHNNGLIDFFTAISLENSRRPDVHADRSKAAPSKEALILRSCSRFNDDIPEEIISSTTRKITLFSIFFSLLMFSLGALGAIQAFAQPSASGVNIFWLLLILLGPHLIMLIIWLAVMLLNGSPSSSGVLASLSSHVFKLLFSAPSGIKKESELLQTNCLAILSKPPHGRWLFSLVGHLGWVGFMLGGLLCTILVLLARQVNFVWETTLLDADAFTHLTLMLSYLPSLIGFDMPNATTVDLSRLGAADEQLAEVRTQWASFLILCIVIYGLLPRLLFASLSYWLYLSRRERFRLDLSDPFYQQLIRKLEPPSRHAGILDPDEQQPSTLQAHPSSPRSPLAPQGPESADWIGFELDSPSDWPPAAIKQGTPLQQVSDRQAQQRLFDQLRGHKGHTLVVVTSFLRTPDRGIERFIKQARECSQATFWLGLEASVADMTKHPERLDDWIQLAARCSIPPHQMFVIDKDKDR